MSAFAVTSPSSHGCALSALHARHSQRLHTRRRSQVRALAQTQLQYNKLGDSDLLISEVTLGTVCTKLEIVVLLTAKYCFLHLKINPFISDDLRRAKHREGST